MKKTLLLATIFLTVGVFIGGALFSGVQPRSIFSLHACQNRCLTLRDLNGLLASVGITKLGGSVLAPLFESDKIVVIKHPAPTTSFHEVILPKKDIRDISEISPEDIPYIEEVFAYISQSVEKNKLVKYRVVTNGPGYQSVSYLHFHLIGSLPK